ncbi:IS1595 family transposase [Alicyclobacillus tolerans]|uniref:IS1595 family transposase n=1 Tax=Alicyclobacillus tolerans TaxID=90970 RepID=UPI001F01FDAB|nr:IS1595 family transposase [Alicyclobacillus tolerans]MCF8567695.1 IS1595 family transposase [Alicyclobacillus tolerans]
MNLLEFTQKFSDEKACEEHLIQLRWKKSFTCPKCNHSEVMLVHAAHRRDADRRVPLFECKQCHRQTSVTAGTIFHKSKTPLYKWFLAIYLVSNDKRGVSAKTLQRHISVSYDTAWHMLHKIRNAMAERNAKYKLEGIVQVDDFYLGGKSKGKRGRGTTQSPMVMGVSLAKGKPQYCFIEAVEDLTRNSILPILQRNLGTDVVLETDGNWSYGASAKELDIPHLVTLSSDENAHETFQWVNTLISNLKAFIDGTYHGREHFKQLYAAEFTYRLNRRHMGHGLVERLLNTCALAHPINASQTV